MKEYSQRKRARKSLKEIRNRRDSLPPPPGIIAGFTGFRGWSTTNFGVLGFFIVVIIALLLLTDFGNTIAFKIGSLTVNFG